ncbi:MAG: serine hydrolase domain-containing protein, partial [Steroidobacteraceae bacterium]
LEPRARMAVARLAFLSCAVIALGATSLQSAAAHGHEVVSGELGNKLDREMSRLTEKGFAGVVFVSRRGSIVLAKGYGLADREAMRPFTRDTVFDMGSITKPFTAAAILRLEADGKLRLNDPLTRWFDGVPPDKRTITIQQLLTHSAGFDGALGDDYEDRVTRDAYVKRALQSNLIHRPGGRYAYSNIGYSLLGAIIEHASGMGYERYLREKLFVPAHMYETGYILPKWKGARINHTYSHVKDYGPPDKRPWAPDGPYWNLRCNGGLLTTVDDLYRWHLVLSGDAVFSPKAVSKYQQPQVSQVGKGPGAYYGYGWVHRKTAHGTRIVHHDGGDGIFSSKFRRYVDDDVVLMYSTNDVERSGAAAEALGIPAIELWLEQLIFQ